ncbi:helix-turn-helix domain-containing protein [Streptomyces sp. NPDC056773]|uniref:helix-turn-helix domain-containing protein n=1 Tax=unclassified Streptomyces TaxID=2593676 RepID=UPI0036B2DC40
MAQERSKGNGLADRVISVQQAFAELPGDTQTLKALAEHTQLDPSVVHRILQSFVAGGWVERLGHGRYRLGSIAAAAGVRAIVAVHESLDPHQVLEDLQAECGGLALFYTLAPGGARRVCTYHALGDYDPVAAGFGMTAMDIFTVGCSLRIGASGRALLAYVPEDLLEVSLAEEIPPNAGPGAMDNEGLLRSIAEIREAGFAIGRQECLPGWDSVAAPALWGSSVLGVVLLLKKVEQIPGDITDYAEAVVQAAQMITFAATAGGRNPSRISA